MMKKIKGILAWILILCAVQGVFIPGVSAASSEAIVFNFYSDYPQSQYGQLYHYKENSSTEAENDIAADYAAGISDWKVETFSGYANYDAGYITAYTSANSYVAMRFRVQEAGKYNIAFNYVATNTANTSSAPAEYAELYIFPADASAYTQADVMRLADRQAPMATINFYNKLFASKSAKMTYSLQAGKEYLFVIKAGENAENLGTSRLFFKNLTLNRIGEYDPPVSYNKEPKPIVVKEQVTNVFKDGVFAAITHVNGRDYLAIPVYGGKMYVCDLDSYKVIAEIDTGISTPRGATVDSQGNIWVSGPESFLFQYNPYTHEGTRTPNYTDVVSAGSAFAITEGDDGCLYFGTYSNAQVVKYDPVAEKFTKIDYKETGFKYATAVLQKGDYIYTSLHKEGDDGVQKHYLLKMDAKTYETVAMLDIASMMGSQRYLQGLQWLDETRVIGSSTGKMFVVDTDKMQAVTPEEFGMNASLKGNISEVRNNKVYFTTSEYGLCEYDLTTRKASHILGSGGMLGSRCNAGSFVSLNMKDGKVVPKSEGGKEQDYFIAFTISNIVISAINVETKESVSLKNLLDPNAGYGVSIRALERGLPGSNEILTGAFSSNLTYAYNTQTGNVSTYTGDGMQTDAIHWYNDKLYVGNYTLGQLTEINPETNKPKALITLNDNTFDQSRIHTITSGDNKVFVGTIPDVYEHGGMIAWYDFNKNRAYAAIGPNPEDVYYSTNNVTWYNEVTGQRRVEDTSDDAVPGVIKDQSIICLEYHNGLLYGTSSVQGGTAAKGVPGPAQLFVYDVSRRQVVATSSLSEIGATNVKYIAGVAADPDVSTNGKFWGVVAETLFSFTYSANTHTFNLKTELSFDKKVNDKDGGRFLVPRPMRFHEGYLYVSFGARGNLCKINMENPLDYQQLLPVTESLADIPTDYVIAEDGNLYFLRGTGIHMLTVNPTDAEWEKAQVVDDMIATLQPVTLEKVDAINAAYNGLTNREKCLVQNMEQFRDAEVALLMQRIDAMSKLPGYSSVYVQDLRSDYDNLPKTSKGKISNISKLICAEVSLVYAQETAPIVITDADGARYYYEDLKVALANAKGEGTTVVLRDNADSSGMLILNSGVSLDLNGKILTADGFATIGGIVKDSVGTGLLQTNQDTFLISTEKQTQLAVWDQTAAGYRFSDVSFQVMRINSADGDIAQLYFLPDFSNSLVRDLMLDGQAGDSLTIRTEIAWDAGRVVQTYRFSQENIAAVYESYHAETGSYGNVFLLTVTGIAGLDDLTICAVVDAGNGTFAATDPM